MRVQTRDRSAPRGGRTVTKRRLWWGLTLGLTGTALLAAAVARTRSQPGTTLLDATVALGQTYQPGPTPGADRGKYIAELPTKKVVAESAPMDETPMTAAEAAAPGDDNPKCEPGKVNWHPDVETACKAAAQSGKPVLVFHMMGKLDDRFC